MALTTFSHYAIASSARPAADNTLTAVARYY